MMSQRVLIDEASSLLVSSARFPFKHMVPPSVFCPPPLRVAGDAAALDAE